MLVRLLKVLIWKKFVESLFRFLIVKFFSKIIALMIRYTTAYRKNNNNENLLLARKILFQDYNLISVYTEFLYIIFWYVTAVNRNRKI